MEVRIVCEVKRWMLKSNKEMEETRGCIEMTRYREKPLKVGEPAYRGQAVLANWLPLFLVLINPVIHYVSCSRSENDFWNWEMCRDMEPVTPLRLVSYRNIRFQVILFTPEIVLSFWHISIAMHALCVLDTLCVLMNNITFPFLHYNTIPVNRELQEFSEI